ncbi:hypothetical protein CHS0354_035586, partial [Potamilus streckersoni]
SSTGAVQAAQLTAQLTAPIQCPQDKLKGKEQPRLQCLLPHKLPSYNNALFEEKGPLPTNKLQGPQLGTGGHGP